jgi:hypothetical protein
MMPTPKFSIGDRAYSVSTQTIYERLPCPDCLGSRIWKAVSPAGTECTVDCPRCVQRWSDIPSLDIPVVKSFVRSLTIGSIRIDTHEQEHPVEYMCDETGVGSGRIHYESRLFATEAEAQVAADAEATTQTAAVQSTPAATKAKHFSVLSIKLACADAMWNAVWNSWYAYRNLLENLDGFLEED